MAAKEAMVQRPKPSDMKAVLRGRAGESPSLFRALEMLREQTLLQLSLPPEPAAADKDCYSEVGHLDVGDSEAA